MCTNYALNKQMHFVFIMGYNFKNGIIIQKKYYYFAYGLGRLKLKY